MKTPDNKKGFELLNKKLIAMRREIFKDFLKFREYYFKEYHSSPGAKFHMEVCRLLMKMHDKRGAKLAIAAPRDSAKSTIVNLEYVLFCICYRLENYIVIVSHNREKAAMFLRDIKDELEHNDLLKQDFPEACFMNVKPKPSPWKENEILTPNKVKVTALGTAQEPRGLGNKKERPSLIILDDIESSEATQAPESFNKLEDWLTKSAFKAGTDDTNIVYIGTIHHYGSLLARVTSPDEFPGWDKRIYKSILRHADRMDLWDEWRQILLRKASHKNKDGKEGAELFFKDHKKAMLKGSKVLWPERKRYERLMLQREEEGAFSFDSEMQNEPVNRRDCMFPPEEMHYWTKLYKTEEELFKAIMYPGNIVEFFGGCDPSMGKDNLRGDRSAIITIAYSHNDQKIYVIDASLEMRKPDRQYKDIIMYHRQRTYSHFAFEMVGAQEAMAMDLEKRIRDEGLLLNIWNPPNAHMDKITKIQMLQPRIKFGDILFSEQHRLLLEEMMYFPKGRYDDGLDALRMAVEACLQAPLLLGGYPQSFKNNNTCTSHALIGEEDLRYTTTPQVYRREQKDRFVPDPSDY